MLLMHRVGFGYRPEEEITTDNVGDALSQLNCVAPRVGLRTLQQMDTRSEPWPEELTYSLEKRIELAQAYRVKDEELAEDTQISEVDRLKLEKEYWERFQVFRYDQLSLVHQATYGADGVRQRFLHFWMNHFTIGSTNGTRFYMGHLYQDVIGNGIGGYFSDLTYDVIRHPSMLTYLDNVYSVGENSKEARDNKRRDNIGLNDNLARELLELHTVSPRVKYTEDDVHNTAKVLAGWGHIFNHPKAQKYFREAGVRDFHDAYFWRRSEPGEKKILGKVYPSGKESLRLLIDDLSTSDSTIEFISHKLCLHFISDQPSSEDIIYVTRAWQQSGGYLPHVHKAVIERSALADAQKIQWPLTWALSLARISAATIFCGWEDLNSDDLSKGEVRPRKIMEELGQDFWSNRQPDGFSLYGIDWISPEYMERRMRLSSMVVQHCRPKLNSIQLAERIDASQSTLELVSQVDNENDKFVLLACSKEMMGAL